MARKQKRPFSFYDRGFTLTEILVAIAIMSILAAIAVPNWSALLPTFALKSAMRQIQSELHRAKSLAASRNNRYNVIFSANSYQVRKNTNTCVLPTYPDTDAIKPLPDGINVKATTPPATYPTLCFTPRGTSDTGTVTLCNSKGAGKSIVVSGTGRIRTEDASC